MKGVKFRDNFVKLKEEGPRNATTTNFYGSYFLSENEHMFDINEFEKNLEMKMHKNEENLLILEVKNLNVSIANALRRIMLAEVPTIAIEKVNIFQNTGIIADEILCHRLGLIPFKFDADLINFKEEYEKYNHLNCFCFKLHVKFTKKAGSSETSQSIYSRDLKWCPINEQQKLRFQKNPPKVVDDNILITKLANGQEIELICFLEKGIGKTHAKWSPVCTAVYKMYPSFSFNTCENFTKEEKNDLVNICPRNVFDVEDSDTLVAKNPLNCSSCRVCIEKYPKKISFEKVKNHFIFTIESTGCFSSADIFRKALLILKDKVVSVKEVLEDQTKT
ncbi:DNA-directed RNA polymerase I, putative [Plasmodium knowlesi strain H]|uniref:DNA-directed RNA polymerase I, putative n=3 Tax=Plasmodium knowlesi TaxID=5850 RepID=A0A5K1VAF1_PLAKH|nr:DNA-directed RNA polymerases I and III subunit RPAC1, putative [Plasmodium knowlesi strain H]OTN64899.1 putative DNA-diDNA-directed RNA polymerase I [Plasmodium knowlesi]CAA9988455.1 DNA-directed RNA polymerases I and III subunit RPAC1, putative [Plasmodium knowlesi strain H]SBO19816.1 DNA-directed RNA polymerase I, putative [Plasmodium knowlesi strain H]SBO20451.1 DNA-directed RNA polymerase I, putative [Plasmodium knowlesi strain H]VVS77929.1 DNA-directed RNA polymerases I and III subunit|eukprot:XP_002259436.1 DNA-diDNA-directed RNA polymerase I, putative [Plasmodium knowlesi strain H]